MGTVYLAEQREPIRRRVALKVVKPGMDTTHVLARFNNERQALAMMDHPNIAQIFDAGATTSGCPYFVMEYIEGASITQYCDGKRMAIKDRRLRAKDCNTGNILDQQQAVAASSLGCIQAWTGWGYRLADVLACGCATAGSASAWRNGARHLCPVSLSHASDDCS